MSRVLSGMRRRIMNILVSSVLGLSYFGENIYEPNLVNVYDEWDEELVRVFL